VEAIAKDTAHQTAMLLSVIEILANHSSYVHRTAIAQVMIDAVRRVDPDVLTAPVHLQ
jgi:hypothetical protein